MNNNMKYYSYRYPVFSELKLELYTDKEYNRKFHQNVLEDTLSNTINPIAINLFKYKELLGNTYRPTQVLMSHLYYGYNHINQFGGEYNIALFQALVRMNRLIIRTLTNHNIPFNRIRTKDILSIIEPIDIATLHIVKYNSHRIKCKLSWIEKNPY